MLKQGLGISGEFIDTLLQQAESTPSGHDILDECLAIATLLLDKNKKYGDSALAPRRIFSRADPVAQIEVRLDDKLSRIINRKSDGSEDEDVVLDLVGYLILLRIARKRAAVSADAAERAP